MDPNGELEVPGAALAVALGAADWELEPEVVLRSPSLARVSTQ